eukprot:CAMPEP_0206266450 /NCGR_PEP_ID=MMETSP0047_2-20121206/30580_1 /ASSEMBLY_ACC=CAM_ASM_000192 /TAXON_ID=195065 /ORGANISM="Chroomonas mesostigmatica_cf, Strain CCMP1168" /LENGTH=64 /DNA_ID=CAMNT_0053694503 /DNA_START=280 /DNA_END=471 /DNA_ORIENTATION=-
MCSECHVHISVAWAPPHDLAHDLDGLLLIPRLVQRKRPVRACVKGALCVALPQKERLCCGVVVD